MPTFTIQADGLTTMDTYELDAAFPPLELKFTVSPDGTIGFTHTVQLDEITQELVDEMLPGINELAKLLRS